MISYCLCLSCVSMRYFPLLLYFAYFTYIITAFLFSPFSTDMNCEVIMDNVVTDPLFVSLTIQWKFSFPNAHFLPAARPAAAAEKAGTLGEVTCGINSFQV